MSSMSNEFEPYVQPPARNFQLKAYHVLLTYSQADRIETSESLLEFLQSKLPGVSWRIGRERHQDGGVHYHAFGCRKTTQIRINSWSFLDFRGVHPNILKVGRTPVNAFRYAGKDDDFIDAEIDTEPFPTDEESVEKPNYSKALDCATGKDFLDYIQCHFPRDFILNYDKLQDMARRHWTPVQPPYVPRYGLETFRNVPAAMTHWVENELDKVRVPANCLY